MKAIALRWVFTAAAITGLAPACDVPPAVDHPGEAGEGVAGVRAATEAAVAARSPSPEPGSVPIALPTIQCDSFGSLIICTDGESVCWWGPKHGYGCS